MLLHEELKLKMLCMCRKRFMLNFVLRYRKDIENMNINRPAMEMRGGQQVKIKLPHTLKDRVLRIPYYLAIYIWN